MNAIILAAGTGSRLGPLTEQLPKCLLPLNGKVLLDHQLDALTAAGIRDVTVVAGFQSRKVVEYAGSRCRVVVNDDYGTTNSIVSLHRARDEVDGKPFLFQNGDVLYSPELIRRFVTAPPANACLVDPLRPFVDGEYHVELDRGRIVRYSRDVPQERSVGESGQLVKIGAGHSAAFLDRLGHIIEQGGQQGFPNQAYEVLMGGDGLWPVYTAGMRWWEIDTPEDYSRCQREQGLRAPGARIPPMEGLASLLRNPRIPHRVTRLPLLFRLAARRPLQSLRNFPALATGQLRLDGLDLMLSGPRILRLMLDECGKAGLHPFLLWGTLLGCVRGGDFIRGDHDIDLGILESESSLLPALRAAMLRRGFLVRKENRYKLSFVHPWHPHLFVDLDIVHPHRDGWAITNADADPTRLLHYRFAKTVFEGTQRMRLGRVGEVLVPVDPEGFLTAVYGDWARPQGRTDYRYGPLNVEVEVLVGG